MTRFHNLLVLALIGLLTADSALGCLWDYDTLQMERSRFPDVLELATGKFLRHSREFYLWRIEDRKRRLENEPDNLRLLDDLAVAYDKSGRHEEAIATMLRKEKIKPGEYETYANLGTFYIHSGQLAEGLKHIERAIEINPDAHFGREVYQKKLVEYVLANQADGHLGFPISTSARTLGKRTGFTAFLFEGRELGPEQQKEEIHKAVQGVLGMMRFGHYDSPVLLEALGDLLLADWNEDAKRLAARVYLKASYEAEGEGARKAYRKIAQESLKMQTIAERSTKELQLTQLEASFQQELADADAWYANVRDDELAWIQAGVDVDAKFTEKYYSQPAAGASIDSPLSVSRLLILAIALAAFAFILASAIFILLYTRRSGRMKNDLAKS